MADWTIILTSFGTGVIGYASAHVQARVARRGIDAENERLRTQLGAEKERRDEQRAEERRRTREAVYVELLASDQMVWRRSLAWETEDFEAAFVRHDEAIAAVGVVAAGSVEAAAREILDNVYAEIGERARHLAVAGSENPIREVLAEFQDARIAARGKLLNAIRDDMGHLPAST